MANRTDADATTVHGTNPQNLVEKIVRSKIYNCTFWKEHCFALNAESLVDKGVDMKAVGGTYGGARQPSPFLCLILKMLQIQPERAVILEYILQEDYKYLRILGAFYLRLVAKPDEVYRYIEPLYNDYRRCRVQNPDGNYMMSNVDSLAEEMLSSDYLFDISLPRLPHRMTLETDVGGLSIGGRVSFLGDTDVAALEAAAEAEALAAQQMIEDQDRETDRTERRRPKPHAEDSDDEAAAAVKREKKVRDKFREAAPERARDRTREGSRERDKRRGADKVRDDRGRRDGDRGRRGGDDGHDDRDARSSRRKLEDRGEGDSDRRQRRSDRDEEGDERRSRRDKGRDAEERPREKGREDRDNVRSGGDRGPGKDRDKDGERSRRDEKSSRSKSERGHDRDGHRNRDAASHDDDRDRKKAKKSDGEGMSVEETNKLRAEMGLKPLR